MAKSMFLLLGTSYSGSRKRTSTSIFVEATHLPFTFLELRIHYRAVPRIRSYLARRHLRNRLDHPGILPGSHHGPRLHHPAALPIDPGE